MLNATANFLINNPILQYFSFMINFSIYVTMLQTVVKTFFNALLWYGLFIITFGVAFFILFNNSKLISS